VNIFGTVILPGIPVPEEFYDNYISIELQELAIAHGMSVSKARSEIARLNAVGETYVTIFNRLSDGVEMVSGYILESHPRAEKREAR